MIEKTSEIFYSRDLKIIYVLMRSCQMFQENSRLTWYPTVTLNIGKYLSSAKSSLESD